MGVALIMAGGRGERFWPLSRERYPKQFLSLNGHKTMIQETVDRVVPLVGIENVYIVTGQVYEDRVRNLLAGIPAQNIIIEPEGRDTAPCVALASVYIGSILEQKCAKRRAVRQAQTGSTHSLTHVDADDWLDPVMLVLPSDHYIGNVPRFQKTVEVAMNVASSTEGLVTIGITPTRPETGYGYIECGEELVDFAEMAKECGCPRRVLRFREKPDLETARQFLSSGRYLWNSGMFVWRLSTFTRALKKHLPSVYYATQRLVTALNTPFAAQVLAKEYSRLPKISLDYGILEKAEEIYVVPGEFGWDDVGSWSALARLHPLDAGGNVAGTWVGSRAKGHIRSKPVLVDTKDCIVYSTGRLVAAVGVEDVIVVETEDAVLVCKKGEDQRVKEVVTRLRHEGLADYV
ncbi:MAG TPA: mannose-1-phosphate guanylyltransferase [Clostridia bacterium]|nr:mannose-1-phosphate guanylyltransferase [Clostridia bacterium]